MSSSQQKRYGLQLRGPATAASLKKPLPAAKKPSIFQDDDYDDEDDVERAISRQAAKNRALKEVEQQHKAALEQDPTIFDYDGVYEEIKEKPALSTGDGLEKNKPKYITKLVEKARARQQEQEIVYERKLLKERLKEDHLYGDKEKFVTAAYKQKLAERDQWLEEDRRRQLKEAADEVTKKSDLSDFYRNLLSKNVAFGAGGSRSSEGNPVLPTPGLQEGKDKPTLMLDEGGGDRLLGPSSGVNTRDAESDKVEVSQAESMKSEVDANTSSRLGAQESTKHSELDSKRVTTTTDTTSASTATDVTTTQEATMLRLQVPNPQSLEKDKEELEDEEKESIASKPSDRKPTEDALAAAKERYLARKRIRKL